MTTSLTLNHDIAFRVMGLTTRLPLCHQASKGLVTNVRQLVTNVLRHPVINLLPAQVPQHMLSNPGWAECVESVGRPGVKSLVPPNGKRNMCRKFSWGGGGGGCFAWHHHRSRLCPSPLYLLLFSLSFCVFVFVLVRCFQLSRQNKIKPF